MPATLPDPSAPPRHRGPVLALLIALRPKQWTKNLLLFAGLLFTLDARHRAGDFQRVVIGFGLFSLLSGVVYIVNDVTDIESDRRHPRKCRRPIAAGDISPEFAIVSAIVLGVVSLGLSFVLDRAFGVVACVYFILTLLYTFRLKNVVLIDVMVLAGGFVLRAIAGAVLVSVGISAWLILCTLMLALFLALSKRRAEIMVVQQTGTIGTRRILEEYTAAMLDQMIVIVTSACLMSYALYTIESRAAYRHHYLMLTIPFVIYGIFRYLYLMHRRSIGESPDAVLLGDRPMLVNVLLWGLTTALIVTHLLARLLDLLHHSPLFR